MPIKARRKPFVAMILNFSSLLHGFYDPSRVIVCLVTFSKGVFVPAGLIVIIPVGATHTDERIYSNLDEYDVFRFANLRDSEGMQ
jgi:Cytochrome P450